MIQTAENENSNDDQEARSPTDFQFARHNVDLSHGKVHPEIITCEDYEDVFGGIARGFKFLENKSVKDAYDPSASLVLNLGVLSGTDFMTGLRTYFLAYSPLKRSLSGMPSAMWSAGSGKFGTKLRHLDIDELVFTGRCAGPTLLHIHRTEEDGPTVIDFVDASDLVGLLVNDKIQKLHQQYADAHFAVIGPAGETYQAVRYAAVALSTENQLKSGDPKARYCGRGGMGSMLGSKNILAIVADTPDRRGGKQPSALKTLNQEVARGEGSRRFRDAKKNNGGGGTWANYAALDPLHAMPEMNFVPTGSNDSEPLYRPNVEKGSYIIKDESCYRCGISCHKNVYDVGEDGKAGNFRAKVDYEPLNLLASNIGIFDIEQALELIEQVDNLGMDSISCGTTLSFAMEYNRRNPESPIAEGLSYGDYEKTRDIVDKIGTGQLEELGQGTLRLSEQLHAESYAMHCKGVEFPAYLPQTNPGYPWATAGGHMSMRTMFLLLLERETGLDYWVDAITNKGYMTLRDDFLGTCKFAGMTHEQMCSALSAVTGIEMKVPELERIIKRTFLRAIQLERQVGMTDADYDMPAEVHNEYPQIELPHFNTPEFFSQLKQKVNRRLDEMIVEEGLNQVG